MSLLNRVQTTPQELTEEEKRIARENIGAAASATDFDVAEPLYKDTEHEPGEPDVIGVHEMTPGSNEEGHRDEPGKPGTVPTPPARNTTDYNKLVLHADGTWRKAEVDLPPIFDGTNPGLVPASSNEHAGHVLTGSGNWEPIDIASEEDIEAIFDEDEPDPYNPLNLPPNTLRFKYKAGANPSSRMSSKGTLTLVDETENIWDIEFNSCVELFKYDSDLLEVLGANTTGATSMKRMFEKCMSLTSVALFDTSLVTNTAWMFNYCKALTTVPKYDTSKVEYFGNNYADEGMFSLSGVSELPGFDLSSAINIRGLLYHCGHLTSMPAFEGIENSSISITDEAFDDCYSMESGILDVYNQLAALFPVPSHYFTFKGCGWDSVTGKAELDQIPGSWKGN